MIRRTGFFILFSFFSLSSFSTGELKSTGARSAGLGGASVAMSDEWSAANNPAGMNWLHGISACIDIKNSFLVKELSDRLLIFTIPAGKSRFGVAFRYSGFSYYSETNAALCYSMKLATRLSAGIRIDYYRIKIPDGYGSKNILSFRLGLQYHPSDKFTIGCGVANPYPVKLTRDFPFYLSTTLQTGFMWKLSSSLLSSLEVEKDLIHPPLLKCGLEYHLAKPLFARIGFCTSPARFTFGTGISLKKLVIDLSALYHPVLGYSPEVSLSWKF